MADRHRRFLEEVTLLISEPERDAFLALTQPHQRDRFMQRFWQVRDPFPQTARNEFKDRWESNAELARARFADLSDPRAQVVLFFGEETRTLRTTCSDVVLPVEIWYFDGAERRRRVHRGVPPPGRRRRPVEPASRIEGSGARRSSTCSTTAST